MFTLVRDGAVLFANNEDYIKPGYVWVAPAGEGRLARLNFGFKDRFAQGSMNEKGLAFDAATVPELPWTPFPARENTDNLLELIMNTCATVAEAEAMFQSYNCEHLSGGQFMFADATGDSMVVSWVPGTGLSITRRTGDFQLITNTRIAASGYRCERYVLAERVLRGDAGDAIGLATKALDTIHQRGPGAYTSYSVIYDLQARRAHVFNLANFEETVTLELPELIAGGKYDRPLKSLFKNSPRLRDLTGAEPRAYDTRIELSDEALDRYTGRYSVENGAATVTIRRSGKELVLEAPGGNPAHLFPEGFGRFRSREGGQMTFHAKGEGPVSRFTLHRNGDHPGVRLAEE